jgi:hypothetical protein
LKDSLKERNKIGIILATIVIIACFLIRFGVFHLDTVSFLNFKKWDIKSATAADFTIEVKIPKVAYEKFVEKKEYSERDFK